jgi:hypothetical protein
MENSSTKMQTTHQSTIKLTAISAIAVFTLTMALYELASTMPLVSQAFAQSAPEQSCYPPGITKSGTSQNPNCYEGGTPTASCAAGFPQGSFVCRNVGK